VGEVYSLADARAQRQARRLLVFGVVIVALFLAALSVPRQ
jgi:hypothetical protein